MSITSVCSIVTAVLLAAVVRMDADYFVEESSGRLVVLNCQGEIAHQYKLTSDQIALLSGLAEYISEDGD